MTTSITRSLLVAFGLAAFACGGGAEQQDRIATADTSGTEAPPASASQEGTSAPSPTERQATVQPPAGAQPQPAPSTPPSTMPPATAQPGAEPSAVSDSEVAAFVDALVQLAMLEQQGISRIEAGESEEQVMASLQPQVDGVFASSELTPKRFADIAAQAEHDTVLAQRIETELEQQLMQEAPDQQQEQQVSRPAPPA